MASPFTDEQVAHITLATQALAGWILEEEDPNAAVDLRIGKFPSDRAAALAMATVARLLCSHAAVVAGRTETEILHEMLEFIQRVNESSGDARAE